MFRNILAVTISLLPIVVCAQSSNIVQLDFQDSNSIGAPDLLSRYSVTEFNLGQSEKDIVNLFGDIESFRDAAKQSLHEDINGIDLLIYYGMYSPIPDDAKLGPVTFGSSNYIPQTSYDIAGTTMKVAFPSFTNVISFKRRGDIHINNDYIRLFLSPGTDQKVYGIERYVTFAESGGPLEDEFWSAISDKYGFGLDSVENIEIFGKPVKNVEFGISYSDPSQHIAKCADFVSDVNLTPSSYVTYDLFGVYNLNDRDKIKSARDTGCDVILSIAAKPIPASGQIESFVIRVFGSELYDASLEPNKTKMDEVLKDLGIQDASKGSVPDL